MVSKSKELEVAEFIKRWRGKIGQEWVEPELTIEEIMSNIPIVIKGWNEEVTWDAIKKWAVVNMDMNALWLDEEYAKKSKWGGIIAPPVFLESVWTGTGPLDAITYEGRVRKLFEQSFNAANEWEFFEPVRPGDKITTKTKLADIIEKQGRRGKLLITTAETIYTNQKGQHVATKRASVIFVRESKFGIYGPPEKDAAGPLLPRFSESTYGKPSVGL